MWQNFDPNQANMTRKLSAHKKHVEGLEAPRNSLEFTVETPQSCNVIHDEIPFSCQVSQSSKSIIHPKRIITKKAMDEDTSKRTHSKPNTPSVVARLMGMESFPSEVISPTIPKPRSTLPINMTSSSTSTSTKRTGQDLLPYRVKNDDRSKHPQEELLQKFKKDFEEWQASRAWEHSSSFEAENKFSPKKVDQVTRKFSYEAMKQEVCVEYNNHTSKEESSSSSTRIVILKPGSDRDEALRETWSRSPEIQEKESSMQDFLEEVKEKLRCEMQGKTRNYSKAREFITEASFSEPDTKQFARQIAKKIKESVAKDIRTSESTRPYRSEEELEYPESRKFVNRDARRVLSDKLKNVETPQKSRLKKERIRSRSIHDFSELNKIVNEPKSTTFMEPGSPRSLVRSLSAPVSGTAFARLLLEDQNVPTGAHICRKQEISDLPFQESKKKRKDGFNFKDTVSNFRHSFIRKGKLFGKKSQSVSEYKEAIESEDFFSSLRPILTVPSIVQDNSTEVPPSPASLTDSSQDDFFRPDRLSPVSPLDTCYIENQSASKLSTEISSMLPEAKELQEQFSYVGEATNYEKPCEEATGEIQGNAEGYIRCILKSAGLYDAEAFGKLASTKPIPNWVFNKIEDTFIIQGKFDECFSDVDLSRRMLFDLVNEAMPCVMKAAKVTDAENLLDCIWLYIQTILKSPGDDVRSAPWFDVINVDIDPIAGKLESVILVDLINELIREMCPSVSLRMK